MSKTLFSSSDDDSSDSDSSNGSPPVSKSLLNEMFKDKLDSKDDLMRDIEKKEAEIVHLKSLISTLEKKLSQAEVELKNDRSQIVRLKEENQRLQEKVIEQQKMLGNSVKKDLQIEALENEIRALKKEKGVHLSHKMKSSMTPQDRELKAATKISQPQNKGACKETEKSQSKKDRSVASAKTRVSFIRPKKKVERNSRKVIEFCVKGPCTSSLPPRQLTSRSVLHFDLTETNHTQGLCVKPPNIASSTESDFQGYFLKMLKGRKRKAIDQPEMCHGEDKRAKKDSSMVRTIRSKNSAASPSIDNANIQPQSKISVTSPTNKSSSPSSKSQSTERKHFSPPELIPLKSRRTTFAQKPLDMEKLRNELEARKAKKTVTSNPPRISKPFGRLPASLMEKTETSTTVPKQASSSLAHTTIKKSQNSCRQRVESQSRIATSIPESKIVADISKPSSEDVASHNNGSTSSNGTSTMLAPSSPKKPQSTLFSPQKSALSPLSETSSSPTLSNISDSPKKNQNFGRKSAPRSLFSDTSDDSEFEPNEDASSKKLFIATQNDSNIKITSSNENNQNDEKAQKSPNFVDNQSDQANGNFEEVSQESVKDQDEDVIAVNEDINPIANEEESNTEEKRTIISLAEQVLKKSSVPETFLEEMFNFYQDCHAVKAQSLRQKKFSLANCPERDRIVSLIQVQIGRLSSDVDETTFKSIVDLLASKEFLATKYDKLLMDKLFVLIREEKTSEETLLPPFGSEPRLTVTQMKVISLVCELSKREGFSKLGHKFANYLRYSILLQSKLYNMKFYQAINVTRVYFAILRLLGDEESARIFLFDIFYFKSPRNHALVCVLLDVWPEILHWFGYETPEQQQEGFLDPLVEVVVWLIYNSGPPNSLQDLRVFEARAKMEKMCQIRNPQMTAEQLLDKILSGVTRYSDNEDVKNSALKSLLLLSKVKEYRWTHNTIAHRLFKVIETNPKLLFWVYEALGTISRVYPPDGRDQLKQIFDVLRTKIVSCTDKAMEQSCLRTLIQMGQHFQVQIAELFSTWRPLHPLDDDLKKFVSNFVGTRGKKHSEITIMVQKRKRIAAT